MAIVSDNRRNVLGADSSDNQFSSSNVAANADGSMIERQEYIQTLITTVDTVVDSLNTQLGTRVDRATAALPQTTAGALFTVAGGRVCITEIVGEVTTAIQNQANNTKLTANPTTGTSVDICAVLDIANDEVGTLYGITGTFATAMVGVNAGATVKQTNGVIVNTGTIDLDCAASNTGSVKWSIVYYPIDSGATITAA